MTFCCLFKINESSVLGLLKTQIIRMTLKTADSLSHIFEIQAYFAQIESNTHPIHKLPRVIGVNLVLALVSSLAEKNAKKVRK